MMINPLRADSVRLVGLITDSTETAVATIENSPSDGNFLKVRTSLGLLPSDSLLYSDVEIIVEGLTECVGLPDLLLKLETHSERFRGVSEWLPEVHFINGMGDSGHSANRLKRGSRNSLTSHLIRLAQWLV